MLNQEVPAIKMASKQILESLTKEVICHICRDFFTDPVIVECGHNFCRHCITQCWERDETISCQNCGAEISDRVLRVNRALGSLAEKARELKLILKQEEAKPHCDEHREELKLFCATDKKLICVICATSREHREHRFLPIEEAVQIYKNLIRFSLESLTNKRSDIEEMERRQMQKISEVQEQSHSLTIHIESLFDDLRQILNEKEQRLLRDLREEEERILNPMEMNLREIQSNLTSIQEKLSKLQERIEQRDCLIFLKEEASRKRRFSEEDHELSVMDCALAVKKFDHASLLKAILNEEFNCITQVSVTLDVESAGPGLQVSEDGKSVKWSRNSCIRPDTCKRFNVQSCVLGSEGFTSGRYYWEVDVGKNRRWGLGVAAESVERKQRAILTTEAGVWTIGRMDNRLFANTSIRLYLPFNTIPQKVGVFLNYESGTVSFYSVDNKSHIYSFSGNNFTEKLYPFFRTVDPRCLRVCSGCALDLEKESGPGVAASGAELGGCGAETPLTTGRLPCNP